MLPEVCFICGIDGAKVLSDLNTFETFIKQATTDIAENNECLYFTLLFHGQQDILQFTGQHKSGVTLLLNPEKTAAALCLMPATGPQNLVSVLWHRQIVCNVECLKAVEVNRTETLNIGNAAHETLV